MITHNIDFYGEISKIIPLWASNMHFKCFKGDDAVYTSQYQLECCVFS